MLDAKVREELQVAINSKDSSAIIKAIQKFMDLLGFSEVARILDGIRASV